MVGMHNPKSCSILEHALEVVELARPLIEAVYRRDRDLASQLRRAISSVALNLAEGFGCSGAALALGLKPRAGHSMKLRRVFGLR